LCTALATKKKSDSAKSNKDTRLPVARSDTRLPDTSVWPNITGEINTTEICPEKELWQMKACLRVAGHLLRNATVKDSCDD